MIVTLYDGAKKPEPVASPDLSWAEWLELLAEMLQERGAKTTLPLWSPVRLRPGGTRRNADVEAVTLLAIDVDRCDASELTAAIEAAGICAAVYESPSSPNEDGTDRVRVVAPVTREMTPAEADPCRLAFAAALGLDPVASGVAGALGSSRGFFAGAPEGAAERALWVSPGTAPVDVDALVEIAGEIPAAAPTPTTAIERVPSVPAADDLIGSILGSHDAWRGRRHDLCGALAGVLRRMQVSRPVAEGLFRAWLGAAKWAEHGQWAMGAWSTPALECSDDDALAAIVGPELTARVRAELAPAWTRQKTPSAEDGAVFVTHAEARPRTLSGANNRMWIHDAARDTYRGPYAHTRMRTVARAMGLFQDVCMTAEGKLLPYEMIYDYGTHVEAVVRDFSDARTWFDCRTGELHVGYTLPTIEPREDAAVAAWLAALCGAELDLVLTWIRSCAQDCIHRPAAAFVLVGGPGVGKTKIFEALARLWGALTFVPLADSVAQFNSTITICPLVVDDECSALKSKTVTSAEFRQRVQATARFYEPKGQEKVQLRGATREGITANDLDEVRFADVRGPEVARALADRLLSVAVGNAPAARAALAAVRGSGDAEAELTRIVGHLAWIWATRPAPALERFIGAGGEMSERLAVGSVADAGAPVWEMIQTWLDTEPAIADALTAAQPHVLIMSEKGILAHPDKIARVLSMRGLRWDLGDVQRALRAVRTGEARVRTPEGQLRYWVLDRARVETLLGY